MSKANNAPVTIGSVDLDYFESYVTLKDIKVMSNLHEDEIFISIDELKSYYEIDFRKIITFDDTEINGIAFLKMLTMKIVIEKLLLLLKIRLQRQRKN